MGSKRSHETAFSESRTLSYLHPSEREYVDKLKRSDRMCFARTLDRNLRLRAKEDAPIRVRVVQSALPPTVSHQIFEELARSTSEKYITWVRRLLALPLGKIARPSTFDTRNALMRAKRIMDEATTGHTAAKQEVLKLICQSTCADAIASYSIGLEGPPGTGKTHFVKTALSRALGRPFVTIPLGGATDVTYLLGNLFVYEGSREGRLAAALIEAGCCNPIVHFDEVDKISTTEKGNEIVNTLIHLIDPSANKALRDRYFHGVDIDFSRCTFVFSYNDPSRISPILLDRIKRIQISSPSDVERLNIIRDHIIPRVQKRLNSTITLNEEVQAQIVSNNREEGMRFIEKQVDHIITEAHLVHILQEGDMSSVTQSFVENLPVSLVTTSEAPPPLTMYL